MQWAPFSHSRPWLSHVAPIGTKVGALHVPAIHERLGARAHSLTLAQAAPAAPRFVHTAVPASEADCLQKRSTSQVVAVVEHGAPSGRGDMQRDVPLL
jgi:hypothetical protein